MATPKGVSNSNQKVENALASQIKVERNFATQVYAKFNSIKFGIDSCCYTDYLQAVVSKSLCDWQNLASTKVVASTEVVGVFIEPLATINLKASATCPETPILIPSSAEAIEKVPNSIIIAKVIFFMFFLLLLLININII